jgi:hypothetical protein
VSVCGTYLDLTTPILALAPPPSAPRLPSLAPTTPPLPSLAPTTPPLPSLSPTPHPPLRETRGSVGAASVAAVAAVAALAAVAPLTTPPPFSAPPALAAADTGRSCSATADAAGDATGAGTCGPPRPLPTAAAGTGGLPVLNAVCEGFCFVLPRPPFKLPSTVATGD